MSIMSAFRAFLWFTSSGLSITHAQQILDASKLAEYDRWVTRYGADVAILGSPAETQSIQAAKSAAMNERLERIREDPEILPYLKALFWRHYLNPETTAAGGVKSILNAIAAKSEITELDVADITTEVDRLLEQPFEGYSSDRNNFLLTDWIENIPLRLPSQDNINRSLRILKRSDSVDWYSPKLRSLPVLAQIGNADVLPFMKQTQEWFEKMAEGTSEKSEENHDAAKAKHLIMAMQQRLGRESAGPLREGRNQVSETPQGTSGRGNSAPPLPIPETNHGLLLAMASLFLLPVFYVIWGKKFQD